MHETLVLLAVYSYQVKNLHIIIIIMTGICRELLGAIKYSTAADTACVLHSREVRGHAPKQFITSRRVFHRSGFSSKHETR